MSMTCCLGTETIVKSILWLILEQHDDQQRFFIVYFAENCFPGTYLSCEKQEPHGNFKFRSQNFWKHKWSGQDSILTLPFGSHVCSSMPQPLHIQTFSQMNKTVLCSHSSYYSWSYSPYNSINRVFFSSCLWLRVGASQTWGKPLWCNCVVFGPDSSNAWWLVETSVNCCPCKHQFLMFWLVFHLPAGWYIISEFLLAMWMQPE